MGGKTFQQEEWRVQWLGGGNEFRRLMGQKGEQRGRSQRDTLSMGTVGGRVTVATEQSSPPAH